jgi:hypothetical protein
MLILTDSQQVPLTVGFTDKAGNPATVDGAPVWSSSDPTVLTVTADDATGLTATAVATGKLGTAQVNVTADADLSPNVANISNVLDVTVQAGAAVAANISPGTPVEKP